MPTIHGVSVDIGHDDIVEAIVDDPDLIITAAEVMAKKRNNPGNHQCWERVLFILNGAVDSKPTSLENIAQWVQMFERMDHLDRERAMAELARVQQ